MSDIIERNMKCAQQLLEAGATIDNLAMMLRRMIWMARKDTGDTSMKVLAGQADQLLQKYGLQGSPLKNEL